VGRSPVVAPYTARARGKSRLVPRAHSQRKGPRPCGRGPFLSQAASRSESANGGAEARRGAFLLGAAGKAAAPLAQLGLLILLERLERGAEVCIRAHGRAALVGEETGGRRTIAIERRLQAGLRVDCRRHVGVNRRIAGERLGLGLDAHLRGAGKRRILDF